MDKQPQRNERCSWKLPLLLSDAARYMIKTTQTPQVMYLRLLPVSCAAHLLRNYAKHVRAHYKAADNVIASVKAATVKNKTAVLYSHPTVYRHLHNQFWHVGGIILLCG